MGGDIGEIQLASERELIPLTLEFDIHLTTGENRFKGKMGRKLTLY